MQSVIQPLLIMCINSVSNYPDVSFNSVNEYLIENISRSSEKTKGGLMFYGSVIKDIQFFFLWQPVVRELNKASCL